MRISIFLLLAACTGDTPPGDSAEPQETAAPDTDTDTAPIDTEDSRPPDMPSRYGPRRPRIRVEAEGG